MTAMKGIKVPMITYSQIRTETFRHQAINETVISMGDTVRAAVNVALAHPEELAEALAKVKEQS